MLHTESRKLLELSRRRIRVALDEIKLFAVAQGERAHHNVRISGQANGCVVRGHDGRNVGTSLQCFNATTVPPARLSRAGYRLLMLE